MKKQSQQKPTSSTQQSGKPSAEVNAVLVKVPVKISIWHGETKLQEHEDVIDLDFSSSTFEGRRNTHSYFYFKGKGLSTDEAMFTIACKAAEEFSQQRAAKLYTSPSLELQVRIKRNGEITYGKFV